MAISLCQCGTLLTSGGWSRLVLASRLSRATPYSAIGYLRPAQNVARGALGSHRFAPASFHIWPPPRLSQSLHSRGPARRLYAGGGEGAL